MEEVKWEGEEKVHETVQIKYVFEDYKYTGVHRAPPIPANGDTD